MAFVWLHYPSLAHGFAAEIAQIALELGIAPIWPMSVPVKILATPSPDFGDRAGLSPAQIAAWSDCQFVLATSWGLELRHRYGVTPAQLLAKCELTRPGSVGPAIWASPAGWLYQPITPGRLLDWLTELEQKPPAWFMLSPRSIPIESNVLKFGLTYSHARCCSLLRLAQREGLPRTQGAQQSTLGSGSVSAAEMKIWQLLLNFPLALSASPMLWIEPNRLPALPLKWPPPPKRLVAYLANWVTGFDRWERHCQLMGGQLLGSNHGHSPQVSGPQLTQPCLGLLKASQSLLQFLLVEVCGEPAPQEL